MPGRPSSRIVSAIATSPDWHRPWCRGCQALQQQANQTNLLARLFKQFLVRSGMAVKESEHVPLRHRQLPHSDYGPHTRRRPAWPAASHDGSQVVRRGGDGGDDPVGLPPKCRIVEVKLGDRGGHREMRGT
jgi:hypothetical protein